MKDRRKEHRGAGPVKQFLSGQIRMAAGSVNMNEPVGGKLIGEARCRAVERFRLFRDNAAQDVSALHKIVIAKRGGKGRRHAGADAGSR